MSKISLSGNASGTGTFTIASPNSNTDRTLTLPDNTGTVVTTGSTSVVTPAMLTQPLTSGTAVASTSGTSIDFTSIPSWVKRITVMFNGVSTNGTSNLLVQIGDSGGVETTGYVSSANYSTSSSAVSDAGFFILYGIAVNTNTFQGMVILANLSGNVWVQNGNMTDNQQRNSSSAGSKTLSDTLDRVRITTVGGTDTFDAGSINIMYE